MKNTKIQWCDDTENPTGGCAGCELWNTKVGVKICYAGQLHTTRWKNRAAKVRNAEQAKHWAANTSNLVIDRYDEDFGKISLFPGRMAEAAKRKDLSFTDRLAKPWLDLLPRLIFVSDMADALSPGVPFEYLREQIIDVAASMDGLRHQWLWLTKQSKRLVKFHVWLGSQGVAWPENLVPMVSVTGPKTLSRVEDLLELKAGAAAWENANLTVGVSHEPVLEHLNDEQLRSMAGVDWLIVGGESGAKARETEITYFERMRLILREDWQNKHNHAPALFIKQLGAKPVRMGEPLKLKDTRHGGDWDEWPNELRVREMPFD